MLSAKIFSCLNNQASLHPVIVKDVLNTVGRTQMAYDEGGKHEARERIIEEVGTSIFWLGGIPFVKYVFDKFILDKNKTILEAINAANLQCKPSDIDLRLIKKMQIYRGKEKSQVLTSLGENAEKTLLKLSAVKIIAATAFPLILLTTLLPKLNQGLTRKLVVKENENNNYNGVTFSNQNAVTFKAFINPKKSNKDISFKGMLDTFYKAASVAQKSHIDNMVVLDTGISTGRLANSRNLPEAGEILIREVGMLIFFFKAGKIIASQIEDWTNKYLKTPIYLDPMALKEVKGGMDKKIFTNEYLEQLKSFAGKDENAVKSFVENNLKDVKTNPLLKISRKLGFVKLTDNGNLNPVKLLETRKIKNLAVQMIDIIEKSKGESAYIEKAIKYKNTAIIGNILICGLTLGYLLPKIQYIFRETVTGSKKFPGTIGYEKEAQNLQAKKQ